MSDSRRINENDRYFITLSLTFQEAKTYYLLLYEGLYIKIFIQTYVY